MTACRTQTSVKKWTCQCHNTFTSLDMQHFCKYYKETALCIKKFIKICMLIQISVYHKEIKFAVQCSVHRNEKIVNIDSKENQLNLLLKPTIRLKLFSLDINQCT